MHQLLGSEMFPQRTPSLPFGEHYHTPRVYHERCHGNLSLLLTHPLNVLRGEVGRVVLMPAQQQVAGGKDRIDLLRL